MKRTVKYVGLDVHQVQPGRRARAAPRRRLRRIVCMLSELPLLEQTSARIAVLLGLVQRGHPNAHLRRRANAPSARPAQRL